MTSFLFFTDMCIYWIHRFLHHKRIYKVGERISTRRSTAASLAWLLVQLHSSLCCVPAAFGVVFVVVQTPLLAKNVGVVTEQPSAPGAEQPSLAPSSYGPRWFPALTAVQRSRWGGCRIGEQIQDLLDPEDRC